MERSCAGFTTFVVNCGKAGTKSTDIYLFQTTEPLNRVTWKFLEQKVVHNLTSYGKKGKGGLRKIAIV